MRRLLGGMRPHFSYFVNPGNPYNGEGFFFPTYSSTLGTGQGWAYANASYSQVARLSGLYDQPLRSLFEGILVTASPRSLLVTLERLDVGAPIQPIISLYSTYPHTFGSGVLETYQITVRNDGYAAATGLSLIAESSDWADFVSASGQYVIYKPANWWSGIGAFYQRPIVRWDIAQIPPRSTLTFSFQSRIRFPVVNGPPAHQTLDGGAVELVSTSWANQTFSGFPVGGTP